MLLQLKPQSAVSDQSDHTSAKIAVKPEFGEAIAETTNSDGKRQTRHNESKPSPKKRARIKNEVTLPDECLSISASPSNKSSRKAKAKKDKAVKLVDIAPSAEPGPYLPEGDLVTIYPPNPVAEKPKKSAAEPSLEPVRRSLRISSRAAADQEPSL